MGREVLEFMGLIIPRWTLSRLQKFKIGYDVAMNEPHRELDATGLNCPMPLLKAKQALNALSAGECLRVLATDPGSVRDFEVFAQQSGHELLCSHSEGSTYTYLLRKKG